MNAVLRPAVAPGLRMMGMADVEAVMAIEQAAYSHPWTRGNFIDSLAAGYLAWLRHDESGALIGYCVALPGHQETHLLNLTVAPARQRGGLGRALLAELVDWARLRGDAALFLEVRQSNHGALALYAAAGFEEVGQRRDYYPADHHRREDAVVMRLPLDALPGGTG
jgi:ribosomal-protein-alanine N-acetyltransferase